MDSSQHDWKIVDWDVKNQIQNTNKISLHYFLCPETLVSFFSHYLEGSPLMRMMPLHLHVNQKSDYDILCLLHIFKCTSDYFFQRSKQYEPWSDGFHGAVWSGFILFALQATLEHKQKREADNKSCDWREKDYKFAGYVERGYIFVLLTFNRIYSKTCLKGPLRNRQNKGLKDNW